MNIEIPKIQELSKLFELKELRDITAAVSKLSESDARSALVIAILLNRQNKALDETRLQQIQKIEDQLAESKKEISQLQGHINAKPVDTLPSPADYDLPIQEHNMAVMVRFSFRTTPPEYAEFYIRKLFSTDGQDGQDRQDSKLDSYAESFLLDLRKEFARLFREEKSIYGFTPPSYDVETDTVSFTENPDTPAINALCTFKLNNPFLAYLGGKPNLGDIYSVKPKEIVANPSENFLRFLHDLADYYAWQRKQQQGKVPDFAFTVDDLRRQDAQLEELGKDAPNLEELGKDAPSLEELGKDAPSLDELGKDAPNLDEVLGDVPSLDDALKDLG